MIVICLINFVLKYYIEGSTLMYMFIWLTLRCTI